jgi:nucleotide-binding universal stress UspA family protein
MKSILLHVDEDSGFETRLSAALDLARAFEGHITCLHATPLEVYVAADPYFASVIPEEFYTDLAERRAQLRHRIEERLRREDVGWDWVHLDAPASASLIRYSILSDVVVVTLGGSANEQDSAPSLAAAVATGSHAPVLALPEQFASIELDAPVLIAWNGSPEAAAAARAALPLLKRSQVLLLEVEEEQQGYPRDLVARYLSRHGVHVEIVQRPLIEGRIGLAIVEAAAEAGAGLIVMGAYGHSRLREFLLGGVTRALIHNSAVPLLLAH